SLLQPSVGLQSDLALAAHRQDARDLALGEPHAGGVLERSGRRLEAQVEQLLARVGQLLLQLLGGHLFQFLGLHCFLYSNSAASRFTTLVLMGSFWPARRSASLASGS